MTRRFSRAAAEAAVLVVVSVLVTLYAGEIVLTLLRPANPGVSLAERAAAAGVAFDTRDVWQVVADLRRDGREVYPAIVPAQFLASEGIPGDGGTRVYPLGSIAGTTTVGCNENGAYSVYVNDRHGFNNPPAERYERVDILIVGDSFAMGACVDPPADVAGQLRRRGHSVINLGMGGNGPLTELAGLREFGPALRPRMVLWLFSEPNDVSDLTFERRSPTLMKYLEDGFTQGLITRQREVDVALRRSVAEAERSRASRPVPTPARPRARVSDVARLTEIRKLIYEARLLAGSDLYGREWRDNLVLLERTLVAAKRDVARWNGRLLFVYLPAQDRYTSPLRVHNTNLYRRGEVLEIAHRNRIDVLDFHAALAAQAEPLDYFPFRAWGHYTPKGYALLAAEIHRMLAAMPIVAR
jgi:hypothetical protein